MTLLLLLALEQGNPLSCVLTLNSLSLNMKLMMWLFGYIALLLQPQDMTE